MPTKFVGFLAGYQTGGFGLELLAGLLTLWVTLIPSFLWVFLFAPYLKQLMAIVWLARALAGITTAVVGVIDSVSVWFASQTWFKVQSSVTLGTLDLSLPQCKLCTAWL